MGEIYMVALVAVLLSAAAVILLGSIFAHLKMIYAQLRLYEDYYEKTLAEYKVKIDKLEEDSWALYNVKGLFLDFINWGSLDDASMAEWLGVKDSYDAKYGESEEEEDMLGDFTKEVWENLAKRSLDKSKF